MNKIAIQTSDTTRAVLAGETDIAKIKCIMMQDVMGEYDLPDDVPEWGWIEQNASYHHRENGQRGIWEFMLNLTRDFGDIPGRLAPSIANARASGVDYILFHQGT